jgi:hypothetical protein
VEYKRGEGSSTVIVEYKRGEYMNPDYSIDV